MQTKCRICQTGFEARNRAHVYCSSSCRYIQVKRNAVLWKQTHRARAAITAKAHYYKHHERRLQGGRDSRRRLKERVFSHYGTFCQCCGESRLVFLALDHLQDNGAEERRQVGQAGQRFYLWLQRNNFPPGYQVLCHNCNYAKSHGGCPHRAQN